MRRRLFKLGSYLMSLALAVTIAVPTVWAKPKIQVYVIGDSLSDSGNLYALTGFFPPSPPYSQRFSNGPVWAEYFADQLGVKLDDLSYGGAFTGSISLPIIGDEQNLYDYSNYISYEYGQAYGLPPNLPGVQDEVDSLLVDHPRGLNPNALYVIWAGANDFFAALENPTLLYSILGASVQNVAGTICRLGAAGARHFAVANLPDIGLTPFGLGSGNSAVISGLAQQFNQALEEALAALPPTCAQTLVMVDAFQIIREVTSNPVAYGFVNVDAPCIDLGEGADCSQYLFWDNVHPTTAGHALFAEHFRAAFCGTGNLHPGQHRRPVTQPPPLWRGVCYGTK